MWYNVQTRVLHAKKNGCIIGNNRCSTSHWEVAFDKEGLRKRCSCIRSHRRNQRRLLILVSASGKHPEQQPSESFADVMANIFSALGGLQTQQQSKLKTGARVEINNLGFHPAGAHKPLLSNVCLELPANKMGIIFGRSGAGKSTLLQVIAGLVEGTSGDIIFQQELQDGQQIASPAKEGLIASERMARTGIVFQFPERHFVGSTLAEELTVGWPSLENPISMAARQSLTARTYEVLAAVGLDALPFDIDLQSLSDGYKRRVALAVQLVRRPQLLLLDEPLAGLDWRTRGEIVKILTKLRDESTVLVVSHDLRELVPLADKSWRMHTGGTLQEEAIAL